VACLYESSTNKGSRVGYQQPLLLCVVAPVTHQCGAPSDASDTHAPLTGKAASNAPLPWLHADMQAWTGQVVVVVLVDLVDAMC
jgi:hypothetical protein